MDSVLHVLLGEKSIKIPLSHLWSIKESCQNLCFFQNIPHMKMVISKSGLYVREPKNINLSRARQDMKKSKLGFCRISSGLSYHILSLVNTCWPRMWKCGLKLKNSLKNAFFRRCGQNDGAFRQYGFCEYDIFFKTLPRDVFSPKSNHIIISWKFMKKIFFRKFSIFQIFSYFYV